MEEGLNKTLYINDLFDFYGELLPNRQKKIIVDYYEENLSLSEIAENESISRNAVYDALKKAEESLLNYESILHLYEKRKKYVETLDELLHDNKLDEVSYNLLKGE